jgi:hypothetical protein
VTSRPPQRISQRTGSGRIDVAEGCDPTAVVRGVPNPPHRLESKLRIQ